MSFGYAPWSCGRRAGMSPRFSVRKAPAPSLARAVGLAGVFEFFDGHLQFLAVPVRDAPVRLDLESGREVLAAQRVVEEVAAARRHGEDGAADAREFVDAVGS